MKKMIAFCTMALLPMITLAKSDLTGYWISDQFNLTIYVEETYEGMKVQRMDNEEWFYYRKRGNKYEDQSGNHYQLINEATLLWNGRRNDRSIRFERKSAQTTYKGEWEGDQQWDNRDRRRDDDLNQRSDRYRNQRYNQHSQRDNRRIEGQWTNSSTGQRVTIRTARRGIKAKAFRKGGWTYFEQSGRGEFIDRQGNRCFLQRGVLTYRSRSGDFVMKFQRW